MPLSSKNYTQHFFSGGNTSSITVTTTPTDTTLASCAITVPSVFQNRIILAWVELRSRLDNTNNGANSFGNCQLKISSDNGATYPTTCMNLLNLGTFSSKVAGSPAWFDVWGKLDITTDVNTAIGAGYDLKFEIYQATAAFNNLLMYDTQIILHMVCF
jgi:hypothetical protein